MKKKTPKKPSKRPLALLPPAPVPSGIAPRCGSLKTKSGKPCGIITLPCRHHDESRQGQPKTLTRSADHRREIMAAKLARGSSIKEAGKAAGFRNQKHIYEVASSEEVQRRVAARIEKAYGFTPVEMVGILVDQARGDIYDVLPDNVIVNEAHERGVSHLLRKVRVKVRHIPQGTGQDPIREETTEVEMHNPQEATKQLREIFKETRPPSEGLKREFEAAIDQMVLDAEAAGFPVSREEAEKILTPLFIQTAPPSKAVN